MKIFIDPGHGGKDLGAVNGNIIEKDINLTAAKELKRLLESKDIEVKLSRENDIYIDLNNRAKMANAFKADYFISIHHNAGGGDGYEIIHSIVGGKGKKLANSIGEEFEKIGQNKRRIYSRLNYKNKDYYAVIRLTNMPAIITEFGFIDSKDREILDEEMELMKEAKAIADGIFKYLGIKDSQ